MYSKFLHRYLNKTIQEFGAEVKGENGKINGEV